MDVGQGDGTVIITPMGQVVLIDDGVSGNTSAPVAQLRTLGVTHVDLHFASHYHADHIGAISQIVASGVTIDAGWDRAQSYSTSTYNTYVNTLGAKRHTLTKNQVFTLDAASAHPVLIKCVDLNAAGLSTTDENARSLILKVSYGEFDEVFGGDLTGDPSTGTDVESVVAPEVGPVEVYKVHHHGSRYSSNNTWLNAIQPKIGVIQVGAGNSYGHPTADALNRLHAHNVRTYWNEGGSGAAPNAAWDRVANGQVIVSATWQPAGVDTVRGPGFAAETFTNSGTPLDTTPPFARIVTPNGGEVLAEGTLTLITWTATDNVGVTVVDLAYSLDGGAGWTSLALNEPNDGSFSWLIPNVPSTQALVNVVAHDAAGNSTPAWSEDLFTIYLPSGVGDLPIDATRPLAFQNRPNPFGSRTSIGFALPAAADVRLSIFSVGGRLVRTLADGFYPAGTSEVEWDGRTGNGAAAANGIYFYTFESGTTVQTRRLVLSR
jgi:beta-lactamase superfamily II metal-dependent hydrolase